MFSVSMNWWINLYGKNNPLEQIARFKNAITQYKHDVIKHKELIKLSFNCYEPPPPPSPHPTRVFCDFTYASDIFVFQ